MKQPERREVRGRHYIGISEQQKIRSYLRSKIARYFMRHEGEIRIFGEQWFDMWSEEWSISEIEEGENKR